jgi:hypothetical protein
MRERRNKKFMLALTPSERKALHRLAQHERLPAAAVVRRLIWREAEKVPRGVPPGGEER